MIKFPTLLGLAIVVLTLAMPAAKGATISGQASVIDGDTIEIHGEPIRILDIDAPEGRQYCTWPDGTQWRCGQQAARALQDWIARRIVTCESDRLDRFGRHLARCVVGGEDMATWLAQNGWAVPYRDCHCEIVRDASRRAEENRVGLWSGSFVMPWEFRESQGTGSTMNALPNVPGCAIKGNINSKGERIYHVPGSRYYSKTRINEAYGERWFCSETEALAAGWRAPR